MFSVAVIFSFHDDDDEEEFLSVGCVFSTLSFRKNNDCG